MLNFWVWNVTNAQFVISRGYKPQVVETGPYGYKKRTINNISYDGYVVNGGIIHMQSYASIVKAYQE